jgi:hypothetical protein
MMRTPWQPSAVQTALGCFLSRPPPSTPSPLGVAISPGSGNPGYSSVGLREATRSSSVTGQRSAAGPGAGDISAREPVARLARSTGQPTTLGERGRSCSASFSNWRRTCGSFDGQPKSRPNRHPAPIPPSACRRPARRGSCRCYANACPWSPVDGRGSPAGEHGRGTNSLLARINLAHPARPIGQALVEVGTPAAYNESGQVASSTPNPRESADVIDQFG